MVFLSIALTLGYFIFLSWLIIATYVNYILKAWRATNYTISSRISWLYALLWGAALSAPVTYNLLTNG